MKRNSPSTASLVLCDWTYNKLMKRKESVFTSGTVFRFARHFIVSSIRFTVIKFVAAYRKFSGLCAFIFRCLTYTFFFSVWSSNDKVAKIFLLYYLRLSFFHVIDVVDF